MSNQTRSTQRGLSWWQWAAGGTLVVALIWLAWLGLSIWNTENKIYRPLPPRPTFVGQQVVTPTLDPNHPPTGLATATPFSVTPTAIASGELGSKRFNILVMGVDQRPQNEASRSDTLILVSVNPVSKTVAFLSIPRDMAVQIPGHGEDKINSAYFFGEYYKEPGGGPGLAVATVEQLFKVPIQYYVTVNFDGFQKIVDAVGGVDVDVPYAITDDEYPTPDEKTITIHFDAGLQHMDGARALIYARTRHADGDFARQGRQRQIILAVRSKALQLNMLPNLPNLVNSVGDTVQTNLTLGDQISLAQMLSGISSSNVISCAISPQMIVPYSNAKIGDSFKLDWTAAEGELSKLFGGDYGYTPPATDKPTPVVSSGLANHNLCKNTNTPRCTNQKTATGGMSACAR